MRFPQEIGGSRLGAARAAASRRWLWRFVLMSVLAGSAPCCAVSGAESVVPGEAADDEAIRFFESKVRPLLITHCHTCHSAETNSQGGLRVDDRHGLLAGGRRGPAIVPGRPAESLLLRAVSRADEGLKMPPEEQLSDEEVAILTRWIAEGAVWTRVRVPDGIGQPNEEHERLKREHWAWQPLSQATPPAVRDAAWPRDDIDRFIRARLEERELSPTADADRATLLRRLTFDLIGLPPTPEEIDAFVADQTPQAVETVVDRLLSSPAFGERWGRHWLDVARYGESTGSARNLPYPHAWRYRDYVIDSFQADKPFDRFLQEQIAGDLLPANSPQEKAEQLIATGFLALGVKDVNQRFKVRYVMDNIDEQIDTVTRAVLALTASCARCHDHKFDPIPTTDYYALAGIFHSTDLCAGLRNKMGGGGLDYYDTQMLLKVGLDAPPPAVTEKIEQARQALAQARAELQALNKSGKAEEKGPDGRPRRAAAREQVDRLQDELLALSDPAMHGPVALGVRDARVVGDTAIRIRGEAEKHGPVVPRGFLSAVQVPDAPRVNPRQSGRLELAWWLTSEHNPLTPRVLVNRVWRHLFGQGLVTTVDNFGTTGAPPSHPELLDHVARRFVADGWSVKKLIRRIVLTRAYQLGAGATEAHLRIDPGNVLLWRHAPRRLDAESLRDAALAVAGTLDRARPPASPASDFKVIELGNNSPQARKLAELARSSRRRSVYLPLLRGITPTSLEVFDFAEQGMVTGSRDTTTVSPQALYQLNDPFVREQARSFAERLAQRGDLDDAGRIAWAYRLAFGRPAAAAEQERALEYLRGFESAAAELLRTADTLRPDPPSLPATDESAGEGANSGSPPHPAAAERDDLRRELALLSSRDPRVAAWTSLCQALLSAAEFQYLR